uniref:Internal scaffolding protein n=2 Tax=unclassified Microvirus TaxID=338099 RepID=A0AAU8B2R7_9VIRU
MVYLINILIMFCNKRRLEPYVPSPEPVDGLVDLNRSEFYHPSMVDDFLLEKGLSLDGLETYTITSDISMLFNQKRLDRMSREALIQHFNDMSVRNSKFAALRSKLSDDQLCSIVKSRYIQSPSELMAYSNYLVSAYGAELASMAPHVDLASDPAPAGDPAPASAE